MSEGVNLFHEGVNSCYEGVNLCHEGVNLCDEGVNLGDSAKIQVLFFKYEGVNLCLASAPDSAFYNWMEGSLVRVDFPT